MNISTFAFDTHGNEAEYDDLRLELKALDKKKKRIHGQQMINALKGNGYNHELIMHFAFHHKNNKNDSAYDDLRTQLIAQNESIVRKEKRRTGKIKFDQTLSTLVNETGATIWAQIQLELANIGNEDLKEYVAYIKNRMRQSRINTAILNMMFDRPNKKKDKVLCTANRTYYKDCYEVMSILNTSIRSPKNLINRINGAIMFQFGHLFQKRDTGHLKQIKTVVQLEAFNIKYKSLGVYSKEDTRGRFQKVVTMCARAHADRTILGHPNLSLDIQGSGGELTANMAIYQLAGVMVVDTGLVQTLMNSISSNGMSVAQHVPYCTTVSLLVALNRHLLPRVHTLTETDLCGEQHADRCQSSNACVLDSTCALAEELVTGFHRALVTRFIVDAERRDLDLLCVSSDIYPGKEQNVFVVGVAHFQSGPKV